MSQAADGTTWEVVVEDRPRGSSRLSSRFRPAPTHGPGARIWMLVADPGAFVMERRMLLGITATAEAGRTVGA